jgi:hypothetical protein
MPEDNVQYAEGLAFAMRKLGHEVKLVFTTRAETLASICTVVLKEEHERRKKAKEPFLEANGRKEFWKKWHEDNAIFISEALGIDGGPAENKSSYKYFGGSINEQTCCPSHARSHTS